MQKTTMIYYAVAELIFLPYKTMIWKQKSDK